MQDNILSDDYDEFYIKIRRKRYGAMDASKKILIPFIYDEMFLSYDSDFVWAKKNGLWGCLTRNGKIVIPFVFFMQHHLSMVTPLFQCPILVVLL